MHFSINYTSNSTYLYKTHTQTVFCKSGHSYSLLNTFTKIINISNSCEHNDLIKIYESNHIPITLNTSWGKELGKYTYKRNILIPPIDLILLPQNNIDINAINCLCQDSTRLINLPSITCKINNESYHFKKWNGYNQLWTSYSINEGYIAHAMLYFLQNNAIFMCSVTKDDNEVNDYLDCDFMSISNYSNSSRDEFNRIDCSDLSLCFNNIHLLHIPVDKKIELIDISH